MDADRVKTVVVLAGLPYSGKTAIIQAMMKTLPGSGVFVDSVFRELVPESEVCLVRWLEEGPRLVEGMKHKIKNTSAAFVYVEIGILQRRYRNALTDWIVREGYRCVPIFLRCGSRDSIAKRQAARARALAACHDNLKIAIDLKELYGPISAAFEVPGDEEGYSAIDTSLRIEENVAEITALLDVVNT